MASKMPRLTIDARLIFTLSRDIAVELRSKLISPEHILIAMTRAETLEVYEILSDVDIIAPKLLPFVKSKLSESNSGLVGIDLSADTKKLLELSVGIARQHKQSVIHSTHFLYVICQLDYEATQDILKHFQVNTKEIIKAIEHYWEEHPEAISFQNVGHPINVEAPSYLDREMGCLEILRNTFGFGEKKKKR